MPRQARFGFLILLVLLGIYMTRNGSLHKPAPEFSLPETDGGQVDLASYSGRPVLLVFWTTSCSICQKELPLLNRLASEFRRKGVAVLTIHLGGEEAARDYISSNSISLTSLFDSEGKVGRAYHVGGVPKLVLVGEDGRVKRSTSGWTDESVLRDWMDTVSGN